MPCIQFVYVYLCVLFGCSEGADVNEKRDTISALGRGVTGIQEVLSGGVIAVLLDMLGLDNHLNEDSVTLVKCAAAEALTGLCLAAAQCSGDKVSDIESNDSACDDAESNGSELQDTFLEQLLDDLVEHNLIQLLMLCCHSCHSERKAAAEKTFRAFCVSSSAVHALATAGAIEPLVECLLHGEEGMRGNAAEAVCRFSSERDTALASAVLSVEGKCIDGLVRCLEHEEDRSSVASIRCFIALRVLHMSYHLMISLVGCMQVW